MPGAWQGDLKSFHQDSHKWISGIWGSPSTGTKVVGIYLVLDGMEAISHFQPSILSLGENWDCVATGRANILL